jgi:hypothetical protein
MDGQDIQDFNQFQNSKLILSILYIHAKISDS